MRVRIAVLAIVAVCLIGAEQAAACSCAGPTKNQTVEEYVRERARESDGVVVAELLRVKKDQGGDPFAEGTFTFLVTDSYKHRNRLRPGKRVRIRSTLQGSACGLPQREGFRFGFFLHRVEGRWFSSLCDMVSPRDLRLTYGKPASRPARASARPWCPAPGPARRATGSRVPA